MTPDAYHATLASIAEQVESLRDTAGRRFVRDREAESPAERATRLAETGITLTTRLSAIADQARLLALTARMEAGRTGEQARAFALVADEARKLAELAATLQELRGASRV